MTKSHQVKKNNIKKSLNKLKQNKKTNGSW